MSGAPRLARSTPDTLDSPPSRLTRNLALHFPHAILRHVIDTDDKLADFLPAIRAAAWIAVDTEADSLHAYPEKVCLLQISTFAGDELVDPLASVQLDPLL